MNKTELINKIVNSSSDKLYKDFVNQFYSYVPIDYLKIFSAEKLELFCKEGFEFFKLKTKIRVATSKHIASPTDIVVFSILGNDMPFIVDSIKNIIS